MKSLFLLRHAKSDWIDPELADFDRPLADRGRAAAPAMGRFMAERGLSPDCILCSSAVRTRQTLSLAALAADWPAAAEFRDDFYLATPSTLLRAVQRLPDVSASALVVGHNPGMHALALDLVGTGQMSDIQQLGRKYPTAALAVLDFDVATWEDVRPGEGRLRIWMTPRRLTG